MSEQFDLIKSIKKWCNENGHDGFYHVAGGDPCGCRVDNLAPCGNIELLYNGDCVGGKLTNEPFVDSNGSECKWAIIPHEYQTKTIETKGEKNGTK